MTENKTFGRIFNAIVSIIFVSFIVIISTGKFSYAAIDGAKLFFACVFPAVFPYAFITAMLSHLSAAEKLSLKLSFLTRRLFNLGGIGAYAFFISTISGYPMGAKIVSDLKSGGYLSDAEGVRAAVLCSSPSPAFVIGGIGAVTFGSVSFGICLFASTLLSAICCGFIFSFYKRKQRAKPPATKPLTSGKTDNLIYNAAYSAAISSLVVCGLIVIFYILSEIVFSLGFVKNLSETFGNAVGSRSLALGLMKGFIECTNGLKTLSTGGINFLTLPFAAFIAGFGGLSVIIQSIAFLSSAKIKTAPFFLSKVLSAILAFIFGLIFSCFLGGTF